MKMRLVILLSALYLFLSNSWVLAQPDSFLKDYSERWETSRQYTIAVAKAMPEEEYSYKPTPDEMTFAEQLMHIATIIDWHGFSKADGQEYRPRWDDYQVENRSKQAIIDMVNQEFKRTARLVAEFNPSELEETGSYGKFTRTRRQFFMLMSDHVTHHRGQLIVYLRLKGIVPPSYGEFQ